MESETIWKFTLEPKSFQQIEMPAGAQILSVQVQREDICVWAVVNPAAQKESRILEIVGTGHRMSKATRKFLGTIQMDNGNLVFHVFERVNL